MNNRMQRRYELAIFDVDGTLLNTEEGVLKSAEHAILQTGRALPDAQTLRTFIGPPIQDSFQRTFHVQEEELARMTEIFRSCYSTQNLLKAVPYGGLYEMLDELFRTDQLLCLLLEPYHIHLDRCARSEQPMQS